MRITEDTLYTDFVPYEDFISEEDKLHIAAAAVELYGDYNSLTIEKFAELTQLTPEQAMAEYNTVFKVYWLLGFKDFVEQFSKTISNFSLKPTPMEASASSVCFEVTMLESMLVFSRDYFGLKSFSEAAKTTLGDYLIARKADYNSKAFERRFSELQMQKIKQKQ
jgi:hypothetical protein